MNALFSNEIRVFPTSNRTAGETGTNWITEYNLASIVNKLVDKDSFVISDDFSIDTAGNTAFLEFNIHGYYIKANLLRVLNITNPLSGTILYAFIELNCKEVVESELESDPSLTEGDVLYRAKESSYYNLSGEDTADSEYCSYVMFTYNVDEIPQEAYKLAILRFDGTDWVIPDESRIMFKSDRISSYSTNVNLNSDLEAINVRLSNDEANISNISAEVSEHEQNISDIENELSTHTQDKGNPHKVTKGQVGLSDVVNYPQTTNYASSLTSIKQYYFNQQGANKMYSHFTNEIDDIRKEIDNVAGGLGKVDDGELESGSSVTPKPTPGEVTT